MEHATVVGHDSTAASARALARAGALGGALVVLTDRRTGAPAGLPEGSEVHRVGRVAPDVVFDFAAEIGASSMVISEAMANPVVALRPAMLAARRGLRTHGGSHACLLVVRNGPAPPDRAGGDPYRRVLVGVDGSPGAAVAAIAAGGITRFDDARLDLAAIERRRDSALRELVGRLEVSGAGRVPAPLWRHGPPDAPYMQSALDVLASAAIPAHVDFRVGDPADVLVRASRSDEYDLLVSSTMGTNGHGRQGHVAHVTRRLLRLSRVDHLVVFDAFTLGLTDSDGAEHVVRTAAAGLIGPSVTADLEAGAAYREAAAALPDTDVEPL